MGIPHFLDDVTSVLYFRFLKKNKNKVVSNRCNVPRSSKGRFFGLLFLPLWDFTCNFSIERRFFPRQNRPFRLKGVFFFPSKTAVAIEGRFLGHVFLPLWDFTCNFSIERRFFPRQNRPFRLKGVFFPVKNSRCD